MGFLFQLLCEDDPGRSGPVLPGSGECHSDGDPQPGAERLLCDGERRDRGRGRAEDLIWMKSLKPVGDFVWWRNQPNGGLTENRMYTTVDSGIGFWDIACDEEYYAVCQRM